MVDRETSEGPDAASKAVGTGPFALAEWVQGDHLTFSKNANYWQTEHPYLDELRVQVFRDATAMVTQLEAGALDVADTPSLQDFVRLKSDANFQALPHPSQTRFLEIGASAYAPPLDNQTMHQAQLCHRPRAASEHVTLGCRSNRVTSVEHGIRGVWGCPDSTDRLIMPPPGGEPGGSAVRTRRV
jgi:MarR-like DNA-binding transcriptional regulator SgrR of sgrS sRNA